MKKAISFSVLFLFTLLISLQFGISSCTKDTTKYDTVIVIHKDTIPTVYAGRDTTIQLKTYTDSILLKGFASDPHDSIVSYLWSEVSGPNKAEIIYPGSASTYFTNIIAGKYVFQLMAVDADGETSVKSVAITTLAPAFRDLILQPNHNPYELPLTTYNSGADFTDPHSPTLDADAWKINGNPITVRGLLKFDLSSIPATARIIFAKLTLYSNPTPINGDLIHANSGTDNSLFLQRVTSNWDSTVRFPNQPSIDVSTEISIPSTTQSFLDLTDIDVTSMVQTMVASGNYGFMFRLQNEVFYTSRQFASSKYPDPTKHPKLVIEYSF
jgi:hypothetical protein